MSPGEFQDLVDRWGEDLAEWPGDFRRPAEELLDDSAEARAILVEARRLRSRVRSLAPKAPRALGERIIAVALDIDPPDDDFRFKN